MHKTILKQLHRILFLLTTKEGNKIEFMLGKFFLISGRKVLVLPLHCEQIWIRKTRNRLMAMKYQIPNNEFKI